MNESASNYRVLTALSGSRYVLQRLIKEGGEGRVWFGFLENEPTIPLAIKEIVVPLFNTSAVRRAVMKAQRILALKDHPNIVRYKDVFTYSLMDGQAEAPCIVMEFLRGKDLKGLLSEQQGSGLPWNQAKDILLQCLAGLIHLRDHGITHCDIKPSNIFLCDDGTVKLLDFGVARLVWQTGDDEDRTDYTGTDSTAAIRGTYDYMAPDYLFPENGAADEVSDIFSLGVVFHEMLYGRRPFKSLGENPSAAYVLRWSSPNPPEVRFARFQQGDTILFSSDLKNLLRKCLAKNRTERFQTFEQLYEAIEQVRRPRLRGNGREYELFSLIGGGGFGEVYEARKKPENVRVAVKLQLLQEESESARKRFTREAELLQRLNHPNIIRYFDFFLAVPTTRQYAIVMELLPQMPAMTLRNRVRESPDGLPAEEVVYLFSCYLDAIAYVSSQGIVHRDIKPSNLFAPNEEVREERSPCVFDFGVAYDPSRSVLTKKVKPGTPRYMAPELLVDQRIILWRNSHGSLASDLFSWAVSLYEALCGVHPFIPSDERLLLRPHEELAHFIGLWSAQIPPSPDFSRDVFRQKPSLRELLKQCLQPDPRRRLTDVKTIRQMLWADISEAKTVYEPSLDIPLSEETVLRASDELPESNPTVPVGDTVAKRTSVLPTITLQTLPIRKIAVVFAIIANLALFYFGLENLSALYVSRAAPSEMGRILSRFWGRLSYRGKSHWVKLEERAVERWARSRVEEAIARADWWTAARLVNTGSHAAQMPLELKRRIAQGLGRVMDEYVREISAGVSESDPARANQLLQEAQKRWNEIPLSLIDECPEDLNAPDWKKISDAIVSSHEYLEQAKRQLRSLRLSSSDMVSFARGIREWHRAHAGYAGTGAALHDIFEETLGDLFTQVEKALSMDQEESPTEPMIAGRERLLTQIGQVLSLMDGIAMGGQRQRYQKIQETWDRAQKIAWLQLTNHTGRDITVQIRGQAFAIAENRAALLRIPVTTARASVTDRLEWSAPGYERLAQTIEIRGGHATRFRVETLGETQARIVTVRAEKPLVPPVYLRWEQQDLLLSNEVRLTLKPATYELEFRRPDFEPIRSKLILPIGEGIHTVHAPAANSWTPLPRLAALLEAERADDSVVWQEFLRKYSAGDFTFEDHQRRANRIRLKFDEWVSRIAQGWLDSLELSEKAILEQLRSRYIPGRPSAPIPDIGGTSAELLKVFFRDRWPELERRALRATLWRRYSELSGELIAELKTLYAAADTNLQSWIEFDLLVLESSRSVASGLDSRRLPGHLSEEYTRWKAYQAARRPTTYKEALERFVQLAGANAERLLEEDVATALTVGAALITLSLEHYGEAKRTSETQDARLKELAELCVNNIVEILRKLTLITEGAERPLPPTVVVLGRKEVESLSGGLILPSIGGLPINASVNPETMAALLRELLAQRMKSGASANKKPPASYPADAIAHALP